jgi:carbon storage regulator
MLYITRRVGQSLMIGDDIELVVEDVRGRTVKLGIRHPSDISVLRRELYDRIREENIEAATADLGLSEDNGGLPEDNEGLPGESGPASAPAPDGEKP